MVSYQVFADWTNFFQLIAVVPQNSSKLSPTPQSTRSCYKEWKLQVPGTPFSSQPSTPGKGFFVPEVAKTSILFLMKFCMPLFLTRVFGTEQLDSIVMGFNYCREQCKYRQEFENHDSIGISFHTVETFRC
jgi:hypothetical protein